MNIDINYTNFPEATLLAECFSCFNYEDLLTVKDWGESKRFLSGAVTSRPGKLDFSRTPWMLKLLDVLDDPNYNEIVGRKPAQIAWTEVLLTYIGRNIDNNPRNMIIAFPTANMARRYYKQKFKLLVDSTPSLRNKIGSFSRQAYSHITFPGGFVSLITAGSADELKMSSVPIINIEEPDGVGGNVDNQGDGMEILSQRLKSYPDYKLIYAGTPTELNFSQVERAYKQSNQAIFHVPCHKCGDFHNLSFEYLKYESWSDRKIDETYGMYDPFTAYYECPNCKEIWDFAQKNANVSAAVDFFDLGWEITRPEITHRYGFSYTELMSNFKASSFTNLAKLRLKALEAYRKGNDGLLRSFVNNSEGRGYEIQSVNITLDELVKKRISYPEYIIPFGGLILTCGLDVQDNRIACVIRAWGRNNNSWLITWTEIFGYTLEYDDAIWNKVTEFMAQPIPHITGKNLKISAVSIDSGNGKVTELVYRWVIEMNKRGITTYATKGVGLNDRKNKEIYNEPSGMEALSPQQMRRTLSESMGVNVYLIGAHRAHSEVLRRVASNGTRDRHYHCETAYGGYEEGLLSCAQLPDGRFIKKPAANKEVIDCEKMAMHAMHAQQIHLYTDIHWQQIEAALYTEQQMQKVIDEYNL